MPEDYALPIHCLCDSIPGHRCCRAQRRGSGECRTQRLWSTFDDVGLNVKGAGNIGGDLQSEIGLFRFIQYATVDGVTVNWRFIVPFGSVNNVNIRGAAQNSSSGISDPIIGGSIWPINMPDTATYLGIPPLLTVPIGKYHGNDAINIGSNRWQGDMQVAFQTALGRTGQAHRFVFAL